MIPYGRQSISDADIEAVVSVLRSDFLTQGPQVPAFETAFSERVDAPFAVASNSATSALHLAYLALGVGPGDVVWTSPITFVATANAALYCGADVDFVDIDPRTYNLSSDALAQKLAEAERSGRLPKVVTPVHFAGQPCDMKAIAQLSQQYGFSVVEDASHAVGASYRDERVGHCGYSDITVFSFHPVKILTTAEGGLATTQQATLAERMALLRSHGVTRDPDQLDHPDEGGWYYEQQSLGFNYRMTDLQAALGVAQLQRLDRFIDARRKLAARYDDRLAELPLVLPWQHQDGRSSYHLYPVCLPKEIDRLHAYEQLRAAGIGVNVHYIPVPNQPYYQRSGFCPDDYPEAQRYYASALSLPLYADLSEADQDSVIDALTRILG
ncbi:UDP-4-amino-4,6-dideoxy-N-acetyl-beta-L-altrosamine transaminase [Saccharospirillum sp. MSK14-1]|uniref:UDP-4-amino-4, 6-dideoxy-N-acetyl-beta-L-altrosamine transaminase n=1 Tax=Saccharospirillum sp. MSK14-1 TaxID=1897632 RepID=UPI000D388443|nr:UDP-4-amino-4,6-dideoxy-N-acetyl-beta-L-altrosamine transaminase [Saccharospirillum sp. MSK14-1]PTY36779.1 UDP-4-amino-4,6-dideoxy-N-acetyl-beta-L-altrosamine transaminase [Saccharospirillum sp. MSK14-1]